MERIELKVPIFDNELSDADFLQAAEDTGVRVLSIVWGKDGYSLIIEYDGPSQLFRFGECIGSAGCYNAIKQREEERKSEMGE